MVALSKIDFLKIATPQKTTKNKKSASKNLKIKKKDLKI